MIIPEIMNLYEQKDDPLLLKTLHCTLYPESNNCQYRFMLKTLEKLKKLEEEIKECKILTIFRNLNYFIFILFNFYFSV